LVVDANYKRFDLIVDGGAGNDRFLFWSSHNWVYRFDGGAGDDSFILYEDQMVGSINGGAGNDVVDDSGRDWGPIPCDGGSGYDTYNLGMRGRSDDKVQEVTVPTGIEAFTVGCVGDLVVRGNDLNNNIDTIGINVTVYGNGGNDRINVGLDVAIIGSTDSAHGLADGGSGNDTLVGDFATVFKGGPGNDTADFSTRAENLKISLDNVANDGGAGDNANVLADVENVIGGSGNDKLVGNPFANNLQGGAGNDTLYGGAGNDTLDGGSGRDMLFGQDGNDTLFAKDGRTDTLDGGSGFDTAQRDKSVTISDQVLNVEAFI
jgi:Ca2+-binding RTX toxin-like protein